MDWARVGAVVRLEVQVQRREPLTVLYMLVFALLAMAFAAAGPVELVRDRGAVPRDAPWSLMLASTAITAFGQVITTMVAATVVLRDRADRVADLLVATRLTSREYLLAKLLAALLMLMLIYAAIPLGLILGSLLGGGTVVRAVTGTVTPFVVVVLPTMLAVGALQFAAGVLSGRLWVIVGQGLVLIWLWTATIGWAENGATGVVSLLDPFGSAPLLVSTREWTDAERLVRPMPMSSLLFASRIAWLAVGASMATIAIVRTPSRRVATAAAPRSDDDVPVHTVGVALKRAPAPRWWRGMIATARYVSRWMLRDTGWRVLALLGALNIGAHAWSDGVASDIASPTLVALRLIQEHGRLFLILLATIYAGEVYWREEEERSAAFFSAAPIPDGALLAGRVAGVVAAQCALVVLLVLAAVVGVATARGEVAAGAFLAAPRWVLLPFVSWMLVALAVHVVVRQKVVAHLLCIAAWAVASVRFGAAVPDADARVPAWGWVLTCLLACLVIRWRWTRDAVGRRSGRVALATAFEATLV
ncbi:MAG: hypothetical protein V4813_17795 [Gemmatimonadota bacterium]